MVSIYFHLSDREVIHIVESLQRDVLALQRARAVEVDEVCAEGCGHPGVGVAQGVGDRG